jgi:3-hydroxyisobutyrate dehydrogenase
MGLPMATRLADAGYALVGYDASSDAMAAFIDVPNVTAVDEARAVAEDTDALVLMLPNSALVEAVVRDGGVLATMAPGSLLIDMGSSNPLSTRTLGAESASRGVRFVDAPVSGGVRGAIAGNLTVMVGGADADVALCRPLLAVLGSKVLHVGPLGAGHALKALNNLLSACSLLASSEAIEVGKRFGLDPNVMLDAINGSSGRSFSTEQKLPDFVLSESFDSGFGLGLMAKDMRTAVSLAERLGVPMALGTSATELWEKAVEDLGPGADHTEIAVWAAR